MIIVGTVISDTKVKVDGCYTNDTQTITIPATTPPNCPENQVGKDAILYLNPTTGELFWDFVDRPLTDTEIIVQLKAENAQMVLALVIAGVM